MRTRRAVLTTLTALACLGTLPAAQQGPAPEEVVDRIVDECLRTYRTYFRLKSLCRAAPHRLSGSEGADRAIEWAREHMLEDGFQNVRLEPCTVTHWVRGGVEELVITAPEEMAGIELPILALGGSVATPPGGVEADLVMVRGFVELAELGDAVRDKVVLFNRPMDDRKVNTFEAYGEAVKHRVRGASEAARFGARAAIVRSVTTRRDDSPHTGALRYTQGIEAIPSAAVSTNGADLLAGMLRDGKQVRVRLKLSCRMLPPVESFNVVGELVGREKPEEIVVVGAHLDSWDVGEGAHDDGAGCVQVIETLRVLMDLGLRPRRTIRCVLFMNEENGLGGGRGYFQTHRAEMENHVFAIESDRGGFTPRGFTVAATEAARLEIEAMVAAMGRIGQLIVVPGGGGADIGPMGEAGVPLAGYLPDAQRYFDFHHSERDVLRAVHPRELSLGSAAIAALAWMVAEREEPLPRAQPSDSR